MRPLGKIVASIGIVAGIIMVSAPTQARGIVAAHGATRVSAVGAPVDVVPPGDVPLESLPINFRSSSKIVPGGASITDNHRALTHGLIFKNDFNVPLNKRYSRIVGTIYSDAQESYGGIGLTIGNADILDSASNPAVIYNVNPQATTRFNFDQSIAGIKMLNLADPVGIGDEFLVAYLVPDFPAPTTSTPKAAARLSPGTVPFSWAAVPGASAYYLQFWEVSAAKGMVLAPKTFSATVTGTSYALNAASYPRGVYHWRMASVGKAEISSWGLERILTLR